MSIVKYSSRITFGLEYHDDRAEADEHGRRVQESGAKVNGGFNHGQPCGRAPEFDHVDEGRELFAVKVP